VDAAKKEAIEAILEGLMRRYRERVPDVGVIFKALVSEGIVRDPSAIENDHVAFRTLGVPQLGIQSLEKIFLYHGYARRDHLYFDQKKLNAYWYAPPCDHLPRVFISELQVEKLSEKARAIVLRHTDQVPRDPVTALELDDAAAVDAFLHCPLWSMPRWDEYETLLAESEYAAWTIYNRYYLNHFTISVHGLPAPYHTLESFNRFLGRRGIVLNDSGGVIKTSPDGLLRQSSTVAHLVDAEFPCNAGVETHAIAGSYVEFAQRLVLPQYAALCPGEIRREHRRDGFETGNADRIFESTYTSQTRARSPR
jgi:hypothetical protein